MRVQGDEGVTVYYQGSADPHFQIHDQLLFDQHSLVLYAWCTSRNGVAIDVTTAIHLCILYVCIFAVAGAGGLSTHCILVIDIYSIGNRIGIGDSIGDGIIP